jgi:hypothetical protein
LVRGRQEDGRWKIGRVKERKMGKTWKGDVIRVYPEEKRRLG